jgi:hypothetical protein
MMWSLPLSKITKEVNDMKKRFFIGTIFFWFATYLQSVLLSPGSIP